MSGSSKTPDFTNSRPGSEATRHGVAPDGTTFYEFDLELACTPEELWKALAEGAEIAKWFAPDAKVKPGEGGEVWLSWGPGFEGASRISIWQPGKRLQVLEPQMGDAPAGGVPVAVDYLIEGRGGKTVLRLVQSGMKPTPDWDGEVDAKSRGWRIFASNLKHYLDHHAGQPAANIWMERKVVTAKDAWRALVGESSPLKLAGHAPGARVEIAAGGENFAGTLDVLGPSMDIGFVLDDPKCGLLRLSSVNYGPWQALGIFLIGYGADADREGLTARADRFLGGLVDQLGVGIGQ